MSPLFDPVRIGRYIAPNRLVMAPMTRSGSDAHGVASEMRWTDCAERAGAGWIISEGVFPSAMAKGCIDSPTLAAVETH